MPVFVLTICRSFICFWRYRLLLPVLYMLYIAGTRGKGSALKVHVIRDRIASTYLGTTYATWAWLPVWLSCFSHEDTEGRRAGARSWFFSRFSFPSPRKIFHGHALAAARFCAHIFYNMALLFIYPEGTMIIIFVALTVLARVVAATCCTSCAIVTIIVHCTACQRDVERDHSPDTVVRLDRCWALIHGRRSLFVDICNATGPQRAMPVFGSLSALV